MAEEVINPEPNMPDSPTDVTPFGSDPVPETPVPVFDAEAERAKIRQEVEQELTSRQPAPPVQTQSASPLDMSKEELAALMWSDPAAAIEVIERRSDIRTEAKYAPILQRVNQNEILREFEGLGEKGKALVNELAPNLNVTQLDPKLKGIIMDAARYRDIQASPQITPERGSQPINGSASISAQERKMFGIGTPTGPTEAQFLKDRAQYGDTF